jgi:hypothetical protein
MHGDRSEEPPTLFASTLHVQARVAHEDAFLTLIRQLREASPALRPTRCQLSRQTDDAGQESLSVRCDVDWIRARLSPPRRPALRVPARPLGEVEGTPRCAATRLAAPGGCFTLGRPDGESYPHAAPLRGSLAPRGTVSGAVVRVDLHVVVREVAGPQGGRGRPVRGPPER